MHESFQRRCDLDWSRLQFPFQCTTPLTNGGFPIESPMSTIYVDITGGLGVGLQRFLLLALFGLVAQLVDGALGMAYGLTSTTLLLASGLAPAVASGSVHLAEVGTTLASGAAHWKLGNTDWKAVRWLALPGGVGAFAGATVLSNLDGAASRPWISLFLVILGVYVLVRFAFLSGRIQVREGSLRRPLLAPLGLVAGFLDAIG